MTEFDAAIKEFKEASTHVTEKQLEEMTEIILRVFEQMRTVVNYSVGTKKPTADQVKLIQKAMVENINKCAKFSSNQAIQPHVKVVLEGLNATFWVLTDQPKFTIDAAIEPAEYNGLKVK